MSQRESTLQRSTPSMSSPQPPPGFRGHLHLALSSSTTESKGGARYPHVPLVGGIGDRMFVAESTRASTCAASVASKFSSPSNASKLSSHHRFLPSAALILLQPGVSVGFCLPCQDHSQTHFFEQAGTLPLCQCLSSQIRLSCFLSNRSLSRGILWVFVIFASMPSVS